MSWGGAIFALTALSAVSQISQGYAEKEEAKFNATLVDNKATLIEAQKGVEAGQYERLKASTLSTSMARIAKAGIKPTGSAAAVMLDTQTQINIDKAIGQFNLEQQKQYTMSEAEQIRRKGQQSVYSGYSRGFSTILSGASGYAQYKGWDLSQGAKKAGRQ